jgi:hypothetical protein
LWSSIALAVRVVLPCASFRRAAFFSGEITMWFAMALAAAAAGFQASGSYAAAWTFASPAFTALLLLKVRRARGP